MGVGRIIEMGVLPVNSAETIERVPIHTDADGVVRVAGTRVTLDTIVGEGNQYCSAGDPTPDDKIVAEAKRVLAEVKLSDDERKAVEAALPNLHGQQFSGG